MNKIELRQILHVQSILGRTKQGWALGKGMLDASSGSMSEVDTDGFMAMECLNCGLVLSAELFAAGCPNCGCKDHDIIEIFADTNKV